MRHSQVPPTFPFSVGRVEFIYLDPSFIAGSHNAWIKCNKSNNRPSGSLGSASRCGMAPSIPQVFQESVQFPVPTLPDPGRRLQPHAVLPTRRHAHPTGREIYSP
jgi:hypothetical protein